MGVITLASTKGGVSKTTSAIVMAELLDNVLLIDGSQDSNLSDYYQVPETAKTNNIYAVLFERKKVKDCVFKANGKYIIPASIKTSDDHKFINIDISKKINALPYRHIIIDTQPNIGNFNRALFKFSDILIIPVDMDLWSIESALKMAGNAKQLKKEIKVYILPTKMRINSATRKMMKILESNKKDNYILPGIRYNSKAYKISLDGKLDNKKLINDYKKSLEGVI